MNKAFTLTEILGVVAVIGLIFLIVTPNLTNRTSTKTGEITEAQKEMLEQAADLYVDAHQNECVPSCTIELSKLKDEGYVNENILDARENKELSTNVKVRVTIYGNKRTYEVIGYES